MMTFVPAFARLPVEILSMVVDWLEIQELLTVAHICARWRAIAHAHPLFWRSVRLAALSTTALDLFQARLDQAPGCKISVMLRLADHPSCGRLRSVVLPAITRNLHRLTHLGLDLHADVASLALDALNYPAPALESLSIRFYNRSKGQPALLLQPDLFADSCPSLVDVFLNDVDFPICRIPAFRNVHSLIFTFEHARVLPSTLFDQFPALQSLSILGETCLGVEDARRGDVNAAAPPLCDLGLYLARSNYDTVFFSFPNLADVKHIVCREPDLHITQLLADHLTGSLELNFLCLLDNMVHITLYELPSERMRTAIEYESHVIENMPRDVIFAPALLERVTTLRIFARLAYLAPHIVELPNCRTLEIILDTTGSPLPPTEVSALLRLPELCSVVVGNGEEQPTIVATFEVCAGYNLSSLEISPRRSLPNTCPGRRSETSPSRVVPRLEGRGITIQIDLGGETGAAPASHRAPRLLRTDPLRLDDVAPPRRPQTRNMLA